MGKLKRMDQIKTILGTYLATQSVKATARRLQISKNTIRTYLHRARESGKSLEELLELADEVLIKIVYEQHPPPARIADFKGRVGTWIDDLKRVGVTRQLLWEEYKADYPDGYSYSQFCERLKAELGRRDLTIRQEHLPGAVMQVDFAGKPMSWVDPYTAEVHACEVLICTMPYSHYCFAIALASQKVGDFIEGLNQALLYFGRLPTSLLSDNLKSYVKRSDRYEPKFNDLCVQLGAHYQIELQATRVGKPRDKGSVENAVRTIYQKIYAPLRNEVFHSQQALNEAIRTQLTKLNEQPYQKREGCRRRVYEQEEKPRMRALPDRLFELKKTTKAKVQRNYHVFLGEEKNYYSVPYQYANRDALVVYTSRVVEVYIGHQRVAFHQRLPGYNTYRYQTDEGHLPKNHQEWKQAQGYDAAYFLRETEKIGPATHWVTSQVLVSRQQQVQSYNSCKGILYLSKQYSPERLEAAALRCQKAGKGTYGMLKRILEHRLDQHHESEVPKAIPDHDNIRGPQAYQ